MLIYKNIQKDAELFGISFYWFVMGLGSFFFVLGILASYLRFLGIAISIIYLLVIYIVFKKLHTVDWIKIRGRYFKNLPKNLSAIPDVRIDLVESGPVNKINSKKKSNKGSQ